MYQAICRRKVGSVPEIICSQECGVFFTPPVVPLDLVEKMLQVLGREWNWEAILKYLETVFLEESHERKKFGTR